ncbi:MAG: response regulator [Spirochaetaceae bacterium]
MIYPPLERTEEEEGELLKGVLEEVEEDSSLKERAARVPVLLVDDDNINLKLGKINLEKLGFTVDVAENGKIALEMLENREYGLVLLDVQMPVMDGYETAKNIRERETKGRMPIIALTASTLADEIEMCYRSGMDDFISKPIDRERIISVIQKYV